MKRFSYYEFLALKEEGREPKVVTRDGHSVRILEETLYNEVFPILAAVSSEAPYNPAEFIISVTKDGRNSLRTDSDCDLFFDLSPEREDQEQITVIVRNSVLRMTKEEYIKFLEDIKEWEY